MLERYRSIIADWDAFAAACERPLPTVLRANTLRIDPGTLEQRLRRQGIEAERSSWHDLLFTVDRPVGNSIEHWLGLFYVQEAVQVLPVLALAPQSGETVLDLCAAPGGKTTQLAARMENRGTLIANEPSGRRQMALLANINRLGLLNTLITSYRGESFPLHSSFDRVLLDAPCSAEGTLRKERSVIDGATPQTVQRLSRLQKHLILRAFNLLRPGGTLVYSTCTFDPEENESVVAHLLCERDARLLSVDLPIPVHPGLTAWDGEEFPDELRHARRIYPQDLDSGGGFLARIERR
ncbi:RsmB/NOP family class I SAM-dependent RNA methyltransferase [Candidatus Bipolaricaulota bacterium]|nr:RsmB/NOP family class I SAM-dependent RNA methyltransferase [Candidatus Bipolaricaulota bacterium]